MTNMILTAVLVLGAIGVIFAIVLYFVAQKFKVIEDPLIDEIAEVLPGANCGGCGMAGCRAMAEAFVKQGNMEGLKCPAGGEAVAQKVAALLGCTPEATEPQVAVVRCNGTCANATAKNNYDGLQDCAFANSVYAGEGGCMFGCLGLGNCAKACPRGIIELRNKGPKNRRVYVACRNKEKGALARKSCTAACIGCGKCEKTCPFGAIKVENNLAYIDFNLCKMCRKCVAECPTGAIHAVNFPPLPPKKEVPAAAAAPKVESAPTATPEPVAAKQN